MKKRQKKGSLSPRSFKITETKKKERKKRKSEEKEKKNNGCTLSFHNGYFGDLAVTLSKIGLDMES